MRTIPSSLAPAKGLCSFWKELGLSTVAVLYARSTYGRAYEEAAKDACLGLGLTFVSRDIRNIPDVPDFYDVSIYQQSIRSAVTSLSESGAKAVLVLASKPVLELIVEAALDTGLLRAGVSWSFSDSVVPEQLDFLSEKARTALNGSLSIKAVGATEGSLHWTKFANERWAKLQPGDFNPFLPADWQIRGESSAPSIHTRVQCYATAACVG
jgi:Receptor family ligand binding region.